MITVMSGNFSQGGVRMGQGMSTRLRPEDAEALRDVPGVQYVAATTETRGQVVAGNQNWNTRTEGTDVDMPAIRSWPMKYGAFFTAQTCVRRPKSPCSAAWSPTHSSGPTSIRRAR
jgi:putative ABC transport system permease protein